MAIWLLAEEQPGQKNLATSARIAVANENMNALVFLRLLGHGGEELIEGFLFSPDQTKDRQR